MGEVFVVSATIRVPKRPMEASAPWDELWRARVEAGAEQVA